MGSRGTALPFLDHGTRRGWGVSVTPRPLFTPGKDPVPIVQEAGWAPGPVWTGAENLTPNGIWSPDHPARSQLPYRLCYPAHNNLPAFVYIIQATRTSQFITTSSPHLCTYHTHCQHSPLFPSAASLVPAFGFPLLQLLLVFLLLAEPLPIKHNVTTVAQKYEIMRRKEYLWITAISRWHIKNHVKPWYRKEGNGQQCTVASLILKWKVSMAGNKMKYYSLETELVPVFRLKYNNCSVRPHKQRLSAALPIGPNQVGLTISAWRWGLILCSY